MASRETSTQSLTSLCEHRTNPAELEPVETAGVADRWVHQIFVGSLFSWKGSHALRYCPNIFHPLARNFWIKMSAVGEMLNCTGNLTPSPQKQCLVWKPGWENGVINRVGWEFFNKIGLSSHMADLLKPKVFAEIWGVQADSAWLRQVLWASASSLTLLSTEYLITDIKWNSSSRGKISPTPRTTNSSAVRVCPWHLRGEKIKCLLHIRQNRGL